ncbi:MAG: polyisoprenoid-binding protein [Opitutaceae bacterium]|jgi:polyisoprenoid-binding protein YceI|nr:polyisoprenoid-binding protein [Opitutaceae bacterium]
MKKLLRSLTVCLIAFGSSAFARAEVETYVIDPAHSSVGFSIRHIFSKVPGSFTKFTGTIGVNQDKMEENTVEAVIDVGSVNTASEKRDGHLKTPDFFDVATYATITFKSTAWKKTGDDTYDVTGDLTIKDVTKPVVLKVTALGFGPGMRPGSKISGWEGTTTLKKSEFHLEGPAALGKVLGDEVVVHINVEAGLKS